MKKLCLLTLLCFMISMSSCAKKTESNIPEEPKAEAVDSSVVVKTLPVGLPVDEILKTIVAEFKGKVVVLDFWATWCPPCMAAMKSIDPIKDKYLAEGKPVAFVYVTGETSPLEKWKTTIPTIKGYHYRLTDKEFNGLLRAMGIRGIPTYYITDAKGKRTYDNISEGGYPGDDVITSQIEDALNKK